MPDEQHLEDESFAAPSAAAALFDLRTVIAILFGVYGVLLLVIAVVATDQAELDKSGGIHMSLWTGIVMVIASAVFVLWVRLKPPLPPSQEDLKAAEEDPRPGGH